MRTARRVHLASAGLLACMALVLPAPVSAAGGGCEGARRVPTSTNSAQVRATMLCLINAERTSRGLGALTASGELRKAAQSFSEKMVRGRFFDHVCPQGSTLRSRVRGGTGYLDGARSWSLGENIAWGSDSFASVRHTVRSWMASAPHRRNILNGRYRHIGIGIATGAPKNTRGLPAATYTTDFGYRT